MQQNGQDQQEDKTLTQSEQRGGVNAAVASTQEEKYSTTEQQKADEYLDQLRRTQADFANYRRRTSKEQVDGRISAQVALLSHLLPVLDDLELALRAAPADMSTHPWVQGLFLVAQRLNTQLDQLGVQRIGAPGETFDPRWHEAITTESQAGVPEGKILRVIQPGYVLGERVIRPARVSVAGPSLSVEGTSVPADEPLS